MYCFSKSFCFICLKHYQKHNLLDINKNNIKDTKIIDVLQFCGIDFNYCGDPYQVYICEKCVKKIEPFYVFKQKCHNNFLKLKGYVNQMKSNANVAFHANLKVILSDPKNSDNNATIVYMDASQFVETQIQTEEMDVQETNTLPSKDFDKQMGTINYSMTNVMPDIINPITNIQQFNELSKFVYDNHFMDIPQINQDEFIEIASSPESVNDIPQNNSDSFMKVQYKPPLKYHCTVCNKVYISSTQLSYHTFLHTLFTYPDNEASKAMKYYCVLCTVDISGLANIKKHLISHTLDNIFTCQYCKQEFICYNDYNRHLSQNPSHKPFGCKICDRRFITEYKLFVHSKKKHVLNCMFCKNCFETKPQLKAHMVQRHNNKFCYFCSTSFKSNDGLKKHLFDNHFELQTTGLEGKHQYNCSKCCTEFQTKYGLNEHLGGCNVG